MYTGARPAATANSPGWSGLTPVSRLAKNLSGRASSWLDGLGLAFICTWLEDPIDERITRETAGCSLLERFERHGLIDLAGTIFAHATNLSDTEFARLGDVQGRVTVAHNPRSNMNNGVGYARVARIAAPVMLGTDGIGANLFAEAQIANWKSHDAGLPLAPERLLGMIGESSRYASQSLGVRLGLLEVGAAADLVVTTYRPSTPLATENLATHLLFAMGAEHVHDVMIGGRWVLRHGRATDQRRRGRPGSHSVDVAQALYRRMEAIR